MKSSNRPWFVYLVRKPDGRFLTGITPDPEIRIHPHKSGRGRLIPGDPPITLAYTEEHPSKALAAARERTIRKWSPQKKEQLLGEGFALAASPRRRGAGKAD